MEELKVKAMVLRIICHVLRTFEPVICPPGEVYGRKPVNPPVYVPTTGNTEELVSGLTTWFVFGS